MPLGYLLLIANIHKVVFVSYRRKDVAIRGKYRIAFSCAKQRGKEGYNEFLRSCRKRACGGGDANHYSFVVPTNSGTGGKPILVHESTYIGRHRDLYSFVVGPI